MRANDQTIIARLLDAKLEQAGFGYETRLCKSVLLNIERLCDLLVYIHIFSLVAVYVLVRPCMARVVGRVALTIAGEVNSKSSANAIPPTKFDFGDVFLVACQCLAF